MNLEAQTLLRPALTEHDHDRLDELDGRPLAVDRTAGMRRKNGRLLLDVGVDPHVDNHHHQEHHQVGRGPEDQVAPAEDGSQLWAVAQVADAVPAQTRHSPHEDGDGPHQHDQQGHPSLRQVAVDFPVHDRDVALQSYDQQVGQRGRETDVQKTLTEEVSLHCEFMRHLTRVEHEVNIRDASQEVRGGEVGEKIVERVVKPLVGDDSCYDHGIRDEDETAEERAHHLHQDELRFVPFIFSSDVLVEEGHGLIIVAADVRLVHFKGDSVKWVQENVRSQTITIHLSDNKS